MSAFSGNTSHLDTVRSPNSLEVRGTKQTQKVATMSGKHNGHMGHPWTTQKEGKALRVKKKDWYQVSERSHRKVFLSNCFSLTFSPWERAKEFKQDAKCRVLAPFSMPLLFNYWGILRERNFVRTNFAQPSSAFHATFYWLLQFWQFLPNFSGVKLV